MSTPYTILHLVVSLLIIALVTYVAATRINYSYELGYKQGREDGIQKAREIIQETIKEKRDAVEAGLREA